MDKKSSVSKNLNLGKNNIPAKPVRPLVKANLVSKPVLSKPIIKKPVSNVGIKTNKGIISKNKISKGIAPSITKPTKPSVIPKSGPVLMTRADKFNKILVKLRNWYLDHKTLTWSFVGVVAAIIILLLLVWGYMNGPEKELKLGANITSILVTRDCDYMYINLSGGTNEYNITGVNVYFTDEEGRNYTYFTEDGSKELSVPYDQNFFNWLFKLKKLNGHFDYYINIFEVPGLNDFCNIDSVGVGYRYAVDEVEEETEVLDEEEEIVDCRDNFDCGGIIDNARRKRTTSSGGGCFVAGTQIQTSTGQTNIEKLNVGDGVVSYNKDVGLTESEVLEVYSRTVLGYYIINNKIKVTGEHPFYVNGDWIEVKNLEKGDKMFNGENKVSIDSIDFVEEEIIVYNLLVNDEHNYFAQDILVHNKGDGLECNPGSWTGISEFKCNSTTGERFQKQTMRLCPSGIAERWMLNNCSENFYCYDGLGAPIDLCLSGNYTCDDSDETEGNNGLDPFTFADLKIDNNGIALGPVDDECSAGTLNVSEQRCLWNLGDFNFEAQEVNVTCVNGCLNGACKEVPCNDDYGCELQLEDYYCNGNQTYNCTYNLSDGCYDRINVTECFDSQMCNASRDGSDLCQERCGNNYIESFGSLYRETCDSSNITDASCLNHDINLYVGGLLTCSPTCSLNVSACDTCGNGAFDPDNGEECDGDVIPYSSCTDYDSNYVSGSLACNACKIDVSGCSTCGNDQIDGNEVCDGIDLGVSSTDSTPNTCSSLGFGEGLLGCCTNDGCGLLDFSGCYDITPKCVDNDLSSGNVHEVASSVTLTNCYNYGDGCNGATPQDCSFDPQSTSDFCKNDGTQTVTEQTCGAANDLVSVDHDCSDDLDTDGNPMICDSGRCVSQNCVSDSECVGGISTPDFCSNDNVYECKAYAAAPNCFYKSEKDVCGARETCSDPGVGDAVCVCNSDANCNSGDNGKYCTADNINIYSCVTDSDGCAYTSSGPTDCPLGLMCEIVLGQGECTSCHDTDCVGASDGQAFCNANDDGFYTCNADTNGCLLKSGETSCGLNEVCNDNTIDRDKACEAVGFCVDNDAGTTEQGRYVRSNCDDGSGSLLSDICMGATQVREAVCNAAGDGCAVVTLDCPTTHYCRSISGVGACVPVVPYCYDSDGWDLWTEGSCTDNNRAYGYVETFHDECLTNGNVVEYSCKFNACVRSIPFFCPDQGNGGSDDILGSACLYGDRACTTPMASLKLNFWKRIFKWFKDLF
ncbi:hypothetical protein GOV14_04935 [Candidatus Pacearchaeota archaeon]|nr:hypothetical protein [Candidatus Pacearchaeota archaeon]